MMCSPYLTGSLAVMLVLVTFNYWSVSTTNFDLVKEVKEMQVQLKTGSGTIQDKEKALQDKDKDFMALKEKLHQSEREVEKFRNRVSECSDKLSKLEELRVGEAAANKKQMESLREKISAGEEEQEQAKQQHHQEKELLEHKVQTCKDDLHNKTQLLSRLEAEVAQAKAESVVRPGQRRGGPGPAGLAPGGLLGAGAPGAPGGLTKGQLPDVDPKSVSVIQKETRGGGSGLHLGPLQPPGGPSSPRPQGISSTKKSPMVVNVGGVMPPPGNLDQQEDDSHRPYHENGPQGKKDLQDDDQDPDGQIEDGVEGNKQLEKTDVEDTKDVVVEGLEAEEDGKMDLPLDSFNAADEKHRR